MQTISVAMVELVAATGEGMGSRLRGNDGLGRLPSILTVMTEAGDPTLHSSPDWRVSGRVQVDVRWTGLDWSEDSWRACMESRTW